MYHYVSVLLLHFDTKFLQCASFANGTSDYLDICNLNAMIHLPLDVDECSKQTLCEHEGVCVNNNGSYICNCTEGWTGKHCEKGKMNCCKCD